MKFTKPEELNGSQLRKELRAAKISISDEGDSIILDGNGDLILNITEKDFAKAEEIVNAHVGIDETAEIAAKRNAILERLGITADEVALLLA